MGLPKIIQIPCHHVLANQNSLKLKKGAPLKQIFNINLGIGILKKLLFLFVFWTYFSVFLLKFWSRELIGCIFKFYIQRVPTRHTFDRPRYPKKINTWKTWWLNYESNEYPLGILLTGPTTPKTRNTWKNMMMMPSSRFLRYFLFLG